jgi:hypoxanthine phosphoribosyltransferase
MTENFQANLLLLMEFDVKEEIIAKLKEIEALELRIQERMVKGLLPIADEIGVSLTPEAIHAHISTLADALISDTTVENPVLISLMDGALPFASELHRALSAKRYPFQYTTMQVSSYSGMTSGALSIQSSSKIPVGARHVIVVDDVCDTGKTYEALRAQLLKSGASSVKLMALVDKVQARASAEANPTYSGFRISKDAFIVGMGMDFDGLLRNLSEIGVVDPTTLPTEEEKCVLAKKAELNIRLQVCIATETASATPLPHTPAVPFGLSAHTLLGKPSAVGAPEGSGWDSSMFWRH